MRPDPTAYTIITTPYGYHECHEFLRRNSREIKWHLGCPTIVYRQHDIIKGLISRQKSDKMVIVRLIQVDYDLPRLKKAIVIIRLVEALEAYFSRVGLKWYWAAIDNNKPEFIDLVKRAFGVDASHIDEVNHWYKRELV